MLGSPGREQSLSFVSASSKDCTYQSHCGALNTRAVSPWRARSCCVVVAVGGDGEASDIELPRTRSRGADFLSPTSGNSSPLVRTRGSINGMERSPHEDVAAAAGKRQSIREGAPASEPTKAPKFQDSKVAKSQIPKFQSSKVLKFQSCKLPKF